MSERNSRFVAFAPLCVIGAALALGGCASSPAPLHPPRAAVRPRPGPADASVVFPTPETRLALVSSGGEPPSRTWAAGRYDSALAVRGRGALLATEQWPTPLPPPERPIHFHRWVQH